MFPPRDGVLSNDRFRTALQEYRREYVEWITEAKREETRAKRVVQTVAWLAEGKPRNWKNI